MVMVAKDDPVMAVVRVKAPADADPYVLEAVLTRAICEARGRPVSAEVTLLPSWRRTVKQGLRRHGFVALLHSPTGASAHDLIRTAQKASRAAVRERFGAAASAKVRSVTAAEELVAYWCSVRGTPHRMEPPA
jgi:DsbC/DsbD-like thiol-disulfide interchange protein